MEVSNGRPREAHWIDTPQPANIPIDQLGPTEYAAPAKRVRDLASICRPARPVSRKVSVNYLNQPAVRQVPRKRQEGPGPALSGHHLQEHRDRQLSETSKGWLNDRNEGAKLTRRLAVWNVRYPNRRL